MLLQNGLTYCMVEVYIVYGFILCLVGKATDFPLFKVKICATSGIRTR